MSTDFGDIKWPTAAKDHRCEWCGETIQKAEKHAHFVGKCHGEFQNWRMHSECYHDASENDELTDGFMPYEHERPIPPALPEGIVPAQEPKP